jgi:hypothetical protein
MDGYGWQWLLTIKFLKTCDVALIIPTKSAVEEEILLKFQQITLCGKHSHHFLRSHFENRIKFT